MSIGDTCRDVGLGGTLSCSTCGELLDTEEVSVDDDSVGVGRLKDHCCPVIRYMPAFSRSESK